MHSTEERARSRLWGLRKVERDSRCCGEANLASFDFVADRFIILAGQETVGPDRAQEGKVIARFNTDRNEAYQEFLERCEGFEAEIERESAAGKFTYAELEENDEDLKKLRSWLEKIRKLDFYSASLAAKAGQRLARCEALLDTFAQQVFDAQDENRPNAQHVKVS